MKGTKRCMKVILLVYSKNYLMGQIGQFLPHLDVTMVCWKVELSPSGYSLCWYIFYLCYVKKEDRDIGYNITVNSFLQTRGLSISEKWPAFKEDLKFYILGRGLQPPGVFFKGIAGSTVDLQIIFLEPLDKMCADILLSVCHNRSLYLLLFLYQNIFSVVLQEL